MEVSVFAELRHLSLMHPCPGESVSSLPKHLELPGEKYQSFLKTEERIVISQPFFSLFTICTGRKLTFFLSCKFFCYFFLLCYFFTLRLGSFYVYRHLKLVCSKNCLFQTWEIIHEKLTCRHITAITFFHFENNVWGHYLTHSVSEMVSPILYCLSRSSAKFKVAIHKVCVLCLKDLHFCM